MAGYGDRGRPLCSVCDWVLSGGSEPLNCRSSEGSEVVYARCTNCGVLQLDPLPSVQSIRSFYKADYYGCGGSKFVSGVDTLRNMFIKQRARAIYELCGSHGLRVLDVGCGSGTFLDCMRKLQCEIYGTELGGPAYERAEGIEGIRIADADVNRDLFAGVVFDVVTIWHVLEHTLFPREVLLGCAEKLKPAGRLIVEVPRVESGQGQLFGSKWLHLDPPRHVYQFTDKSMRIMLESAGFRIDGVFSSAFEMGTMGVLQSMLNIMMQPRDLFYNMLSTRNRCPGPGAAKLLSVALAGGLSVPSALYALIEMAVGQGVILRYVCTKK